MSDSGYPIITGSGMFCSKEIYLSIAAEVFCTLPYMYKEHGRNSCQYLQFPYWLYCIISIDVDPQIAHKIQDFWYPLSTCNEMMYWNEISPLLLERFIFFLRCVRKLRRVSDSISTPPLGSCRVIYDDTDSSFGQNTYDFGYPLNTRNWMLYYDESHTLLLEYFLNFLMCLRNTGGDFDSISTPLMVQHTMQFWLWLALKLYRKDWI